MSEPIADLVARLRLVYDQSIGRVAADVEKTMKSATDRINEHTASISKNFEQAGKDSSTAFGNGFFRDAQGRLRDGLGRYAAMGDVIGQQLAQGVSSGARRAEQASANAGVSAGKAFSRGAENEISDGFIRVGKRVEREDSLAGALLSKGLFRDLNGKLRELNGEFAGYGRIIGAGFGDQLDRGAAPGLRRFTDRFDTSISHLQSVGRLTFNIGVGAGFGALIQQAIALAAALAPIAGLIAAIPAAAAGAAAGFGTLLTGLSGIGKAFKTANKLASGGGGGGGASASSERAKQRAIEEATDGVARANKAVEQSLRGVEKAQKDVTEANKDVTRAQQKVASSARDVDDSYRGVAEAEHDVIKSEKGVVRALRAMSDAQETVGEASREVQKRQLDAARSQGALNDARVEAMQILRRYADELTGASLNEEDADIARQEAQKRLSDMLLNEVDDTLALRRARLDVAQAEERYKDAVVGTLDLQKKASQAQAAGVEGDEKVIDARQRLEDANSAIVDASKRFADSQDAVVEAQDSVVEAQDGVADAHQRVKDAQNAVIEANQRFVDANDGVADAIDRVKEAQDGVVDAKERVVEAQHEVGDAQQRVADAMLAASEAAGATSAAYDAHAAAMAALSPNARSFVEAVLGMRDAWKALRTEVQDALFADLDKEIVALAGADLPIVRQGFVGIAKAFNQVAKEGLRAGRTPLFKKSLQTIFAGTATATQQWANATGPLVTGLANLAAVGTPVVLRLNEFVTGGLGAAGAFLSSKEGADKMTRVMNDAADAASTLFDILVNLGRSIGNIFDASGAEGFLDAIDRVVKRFADWSETAEGQKELKEIFDGFREIAEKMLQTLPELFHILGDVFGAIDKLPEPVRELVFQLLAWSILIGPLMTRLNAFNTVFRNLFGIASSIGEVVGNITGLNKAIAALKSKSIFVRVDEADKAKKDVDGLNDAIAKTKDKEVKVNAKVNADEAIPDAEKKGGLIGETLMKAMKSSLTTAGGVGIAAGLRSAFSSPAVGLAVLGGVGAVAASIGGYFASAKTSQYVHDNVLKDMPGTMSRIKKFFTDEVPKWFDEALPKLQKFLVEELPRIIGSALGEASARGALGAIGIVEQINKTLTERIPDFAKANYELGKALADNFLNGVGQVITGIGNTLNGLDTAVRLGLKVVDASVQAGVSGLVKSAEDNLKPLLDVVKSQFVLIGNEAVRFASAFVDDPIGTIKTLPERVQKILDQVAENNRVIWNGIKQFNRETWENFRDELSNKLDEIGQRVGPKMEIVRKGISDKLDVIKQNAAEATRNFRDSFVNAFNEVDRESGGKLGHFVETVRNKVQDAVNEAGQLSGKILEKFRNSNELLEKVGSEIVRGLIKGFGLVDLAGAARSLGETIIKNKGPLSYDKIMLRPAGLAIMGGLIAAIESQRGLLKTTMLGVSNDVSNMSLADLSVRTGSASLSGLSADSGAGVMTGAGATVYNTVNVAPVSFTAEQVTDEAFRALKMMEGRYRY